MTTTWPHGVARHDPETSTPQVTPHNASDARAEGEEGPGGESGVPAAAKIDVECECCGAVFRGQPWRKYCSRGCSNLHRFGHGPKPKAEPPEGMKVCRVCEQAKSLDDFHRGSNADGRVSKCKDCVRDANGSAPRGLYGRCDGRTFHGPRCKFPAIDSEGKCAIHKPGRGNQWARSPVETIKLRQRCRELRDEGYTYGDIAKELGISPMTVSAWAPSIIHDTRPQSPVSRAAIEQEQAARREAEEVERSAWRGAVRQIVAGGMTDLPWHLPPEPELNEEGKELVGEQERDDRFWQAQPDWVKSLSASFEENFNLAGKNDDAAAPAAFSEALVNPHQHSYSEMDAPAREEFRDPYEILAGTSEHHMREVLGDLTQEQVASMGEDELARLRERIREAGLAPPAIQRAERERLKVATPHRGKAPPPKQGRKQARHRGRNEASALHQSRGKRFVRRNDKQSRDGWGGVVLP